MVLDLEQGRLYSLESETRVFHKTGPCLAAVAVNPAGHFYYLHSPNPEAIKAFAKTHLKAQAQVAILHSYSEFKGTVEDLFNSGNQIDKVPQEY